MKNLFRLDADNNGSIDLPELGNFLLNRHCGEIALQRMHMHNHMSMGAQRRMNLKEFTTLMNHAYSFLGVKVDNEGAKMIFNDTDKDKDGAITYEEYFSFVQKYIIKPQKAVVVEEPKQLKEVNSRLRRFIWEQVRKLYNRYDKDGNQQLDINELENILRDLMKGASKEDIDFVMVNIYHLNPKCTLTFDVFAPFFIVHAADLGLSKFAKQHPNQRNLSRDEFILVFRASFYMLNIDRVSDRLLWRFFEKIDTNKDGLISFAQYLDWVKNFLAVRAYFGLLYYLEEDDADLPIGIDLILTEEQMALTKKLKYLC
jgi:Ca2+-binding EF-hand superfamily protein